MRAARTAVSDDVMMKYNLALADLRDYAHKKISEILLLHSGIIMVLSNK